ncbi:low affinity immunoglobulin gamma Fc region receptor III-B-like isoform 2-T2 [Glossophaga mutica]
MLSEMLIRRSPQEKLGAPGTLRVDLGKGRRSAVPGAPVSPRRTGQGSGDQPSKSIPALTCLPLPTPGNAQRARGLLQKHFPLLGARPTRPSSLEGHAQKVSQRSETSQKENPRECCAGQRPTAMPGAAGAAPAAGQGFFPETLGALRSKSHWEARRRSLLSKGGRGGCSTSAPQAAGQRRAPGVTLRASMWQLLLPTALLLLASAGARAGLPKAKLSLNPEWDRLLEMDPVTLTCRGNPTEEDGSAQWWHNGTLLPTQASSHFVASARVNDSGEYRCRTNGSELSDPVRLRVVAAWLVLQASRWVVQAGEPITLRCHSWKNMTVYRVQFFQNGRGKGFFRHNKKFHILAATGEHNGSYFCRGMIGDRRNESSEAVPIFVLGAAIPPAPPGKLVTISLLLGLLFALDTGLYFSVRRDLRNALEKGRNDKVTWSKSPEDKQGQRERNL